MKASSKTIVLTLSVVAIAGAGIGISLGAEHPIRRAVALGIAALVAWVACEVRVPRRRG